MYCQNTNLPHYRIIDSSRDKSLRGVYISDIVFFRLQISLLPSDYLAVETRCQNAETALWIEYFLGT